MTFAGGMKNLQHLCASRLNWYNASRSHVSLVCPWSDTMTRRRGTTKPNTKRRRSFTEIALYVISLIIILSMTIGFVVSLLPST
jgi:hypothetical protein